jgi:hypothetical protein
LTSTPDSNVFESSRLPSRAIKEISSVNHIPVSHLPTDLFRVDPPKALPLGEYDKYVCVLAHVQFGLSQLERR